MSSSVSPLKEILLATAPMLAPRSSLASSRRGLGSGVMVKEAAIWVEEGAGAGEVAGEGDLYSDYYKQWILNHLG